MSPEEIRRRIQELNSTIRRRNVIAYGACATVGIACLWWLTRVPNAIERIGAAMTVIGVAFLLVQLYRNQHETRSRRLAAGSATSIDFHRNELAHQRDFHRGVSLWSRALIFAPGPLVFMTGLAIANPETRQTVYAEIVVFLAFAVMAIPRNLKAAARYQMQIDELDRLRGER